MKFLCSACERLAAFSGFRTEGEFLVLRCSRCGVESRSRASTVDGPGGLTAAAPGPVSPDPRRLGRKPAVVSISSALAEAARADPFEVPEGHCPKCIALRPAPASSCAQCGLVFANFKREEVEPSASIADQFQQLLSQWEDVGGHDRVLQTALIRGELASVGRLYRIRLAHVPQDPYAARGRDEVLRLATASSTGLAKAASAEAGGVAWRWKYALLITILAACAVTFFALYRQLHSVAS